MNDDYVNLLEYFKSECERDFKLLSISDTVATLTLAYFSFEPISNDKFRLMVRELYNGEYIDLKYLDDEYVLLKPLLKSFSVKKEVKNEESESSSVEVITQRKDWFFFFISLACSFIGALLGGLIC